MEAIKNWQLKMKNCGLWFLIFNFIFLIFNCLYADININATVDRSTVNFGESITLQVAVSGDIANIPKPELPPLTDFNVYSSGTSQNISFVNGRVSSSLTYNFILSPNRPGKFTIESIKLTISGKSYATNPINIEVLSSASPPSQKQVDSQQLKVDDAESRGVFVTAELDKKKCFVNEGLAYTFRFFTSRNLLSNPEYNPPNFTGFIVEDLPPQRNYQTIINGQRYNVIEIKTKLFPTVPGEYNLGTASLRTNLQDFSQQPFGNFFDDDFFHGFFSSGKTMVIKSKPLFVKVLPLPTDNKPADFSGAVGQYNLHITVDKKEVEANSSITLNVTISGEGNIKSISEPHFPNIIGVRKYDTISSVNISKANYNVSGSKVFKTVIIPERTGNLIIPPVSFSYFDPEKKEYRKINSTSVNIKVLPSKAPLTTPSPSFLSGINIVGQDIRFIKTELGKSHNAGFKKVLGNIMLIISSLIFLICFTYNKYNFFASKNYHLIKSKRAFKEFERAMGKIKRDTEIKEFYGIVFDLVVKYLSDKIKIVLSGSTFSEIENILAQKNLSAADIKKIREILEKADFMRFTPSVNEKVDFTKEAERVKNIIYQIEKEWKI